MISDCFHRPDEINATKISLGRQRRKGRRDVFMYSLSLIFQKTPTDRKDGKDLQSFCILGCLCSDSEQINLVENPDNYLTLMNPKQV